MIITTSGFVKRLDFSEKFCNFNGYHHTFGKNPVTYNADTSIYDDFEIVVLHSKNDLGDTVTPPVDNGRLSDLFNIFNWLLSESDSGVLTTNETTVNNELASRFGSSDCVLDVDVMVTDNAGKILPNKLTVTYNINDDMYNFEFWFNSLTIESEYTQSDIVVFGPTDNIDDLVNNKSNLLSLINQRNIDDYNNLINDASRTNPYTGVVSMETQWVNRDNSTETLQVRFSFICYGPVTDNLSLLRIALRQFVEYNTQYNDVVWETVLPEIFTATTFLMIPNWDGISNGSGNSSIYNPIIKTKTAVDIFINNISGYSRTHVDNNFEVLPSLWQSLSIGICGDPKNKDEFKAISMNLDDYMLVTVGSTDFIRLKASTQDFILKLNNALPYIQEYKSGDPLPGTIELEVIDGFNFLVFTSYNVKCKIMSKIDYLNLIGG